jgi:hypothetical protein
MPEIERAAQTAAGRRDSYVLLETMVVLASK